MENYKSNKASFLHWTYGVLTVVRHFSVMSFRVLFMLLKKSRYFLLHTGHSCCQPALFPGWEREPLSGETAEQGEVTLLSTAWSISSLYQLPRQKFSPLCTVFFQHLQMRQNDNIHSEQSVRPLKNLEHCPTCSADLQRALLHTFWSYLWILNC